MPNKNRKPHIFKEKIKIKTFETLLVFTLNCATGILNQSLEQMIIYFKNLHRLIQVL